MDLFSQTERQNIAAAAPLAVRMRPRTLEEFVGQEKFIAPGKLLWRMLKADRFSSLIFFGPPGTGKTTLAHVIAKHTSAEFVATSAATIGVKEIRVAIQAAKDRLAAEAVKTVLFLDEIHRFSRNQQDVLLDDVEKGTIILIGATTENPFFSVNSALVSRSTIFEFEPLTKNNIAKVIQAAIADSERGLGQYKVSITDDAMEYLTVMSDGDARRALSALEVGVLSQKGTEKKDQTKENVKIVFDKTLAIESIQKKALISDAAGDNHFDLASALQKSMRGSDPDATVYWLARLIVGGEDPRFIARRIAVCAAEDVGNADPMATVLAAAAVQRSEFIGLPEAQLALGQAALYVACAPKSNSAASAVWKAVADVKSGATIPVPKHLKNSHYPAAKKAGFGADYKYPHNFKDGFVPQEYLPAAKVKYYEPKEIGYEKNIKRYLQKLQSLIQNSKRDGTVRKDI